MEKNLVFGTGISSGKTYDELFPVIQKAIECGIRNFDTAPSYHTERVLASVLNDISGQLKIDRSECRIQTKIDPVQMYAGNIEEHLKTMMEQMELKMFDSVLIHWPVPDYLDESWNILAKLCEKGVVHKIGICNVRMRQLYHLNKYIRRPDIVQIERNPLRICTEEIDFCLKHNIQVQAYSPLCKMHPSIRDSEILRNIADRQHRSIGQVVLKWQIETGTIPVFTSRRPARIEEYTDLDDVVLDKADIDQINTMNCNYKMYLESCICPGF